MGIGIFVYVIRSLETELAAWADRFEKKHTKQIYQ